MLGSMSPTNHGPLHPLSVGYGLGRQPSAAFALVVVRDPELRASVDEALAGYRTRAADCGAHAVILASELEPDVIVVDALDDFSLGRQLRADERTRRIPLVSLVAGSEDGVDRAFQAGASDVVRLPFRPSELRARVDVHARLRRLTGQLARQDRMAAIGTLAASVAHNLRNPLSALITGLPTVRRRVGAQTSGCTLELVDVMLDCAERIERITHDLLDLSRIDREANGAFAPGSGLLACTRMFGARFADAAVVLDTDVDVLAMTDGRAGDMNHVFMNVLDNALRATSGRGRVEVRGIVDGSDYVVTIGDSGPGIDPALIGGIFEPFWTTRPANEGAGLGLAIARQIVEDHGGSISAGRSRLGGAEFTIRLPLRRVERVA